MRSVYIHSMREVIFFDLGNVFIGVDPGRSASRLIEYSGEGSVDRLEALFSRSELLDLYQSGRIDTDTFYKRVKDKLEGRFSLDRFVELWNGMFYPNTVMIDMLPEFSDRYRTGLVSNTNALHFRYVEQTYDFFRYFDTIVLSHEVGILKPAEEILRIGLNRVGAAPSETVFIDDTLDNVLAAQSLGMEGFQFSMPDYVVVPGSDKKQRIREVLLV